MLICWESTVIFARERASGPKSSMISFVIPAGATEPNRMHTVAMAVSGHILFYANSTQGLTRKKEKNYSGVVNSHLVWGLSHSWMSSVLWTMARS